MSRRVVLAMLAAFALLVAACGSDSDESDSADTETEDTATDDTAAEDTATDDTAAETEDDAAGDDSAEDTGDEGDAAPAAGAVDIDAVLAADLDNCAEAPSGEPIRVGMAMDFGEVSGFADIPGSEAVTHLADLVNCTGGVNGSPVEVRVSDIQGDPEVTASVTQELLDFGSHFLIGPPFADFGQPVLQVTGGQVPVFFAASTEPSLPNVAANSFLVSFDDTAQATAAAEFALERGFTRAVTFSSPGPYFGYNPQVFTQVFEAGRGQVISDQTYTPVDQVDFSAQVNELTDMLEGNEVVYSAMLAFQVTALRGQFEGQGLDSLTYLGTDAFEATGILAETPESTEGIYHTTHAFAEPGGRIETLLNSYEATTGEALESGTFAGLYADALFLGIQAINDCACTDPAEIGTAVAGISGFNGFTGEMSYTGTNGIPNKPVSIHQLVGGEDTLVVNWEL